MNQVTTKVLEDDQSKLVPALGRHAFRGLLCGVCSYASSDYIYMACSDQAAQYRYGLQVKNSCMRHDNSAAVNVLCRSTVLRSYSNFL